MSDTQTVPGSVLKLPSGADVYDGLMAKIEPELVSANLPHLDEKYAGEKPEQRKQRYMRYTQAFMKYDEAFAAWANNLSQEVQTYRRTALRSAEAQSRGEEQSTLQSLEEQIASAHITPSA